MRRAKDDGRLPMEDHNTRIVVVGRDAREARYVAEALAREAFHNVSYFPGPFEEARKVLQDEGARAGSSLSRFSSARYLGSSRTGSHVAAARVNISQPERRSYASSYSLKPSSRSPSAIRTCASYMRREVALPGHPAELLGHVERASAFPQPGIRRPGIHEERRQSPRQPHTLLQYRGGLRMPVHRLTDPADLPVGGDVQRLGLQDGVGTSRAPPRIGGRNRDNARGSGGGRVRGGRPPGPS